jgi:hypothetical protein
MLSALSYFALPLHGRLVRLKEIAITELIVRQRSSNAISPGKFLAARY